MTVQLPDISRFVRLRFLTMISPPALVCPILRTRTSTAACRPLAFALLFLRSSLVS